MKVAVMSYTGTVGKTTIATHVLSPRMKEAQIIAVESINETSEGLGVAVEKLKGDKFRELFQKLVRAEDVIIDIGASNIEYFLDGMFKFEESHVEFDYFVIPVTNGTKEQRETISLIAMLSGSGIPANKIRVLFNRVETNVEDEFQVLLNFASKNNSAKVNTKAAIFENELFDILAIKKLSIEKVLSDPKDYKALLRDNKDADEKKRIHWADMFGIKCLAKHVSRNLDVCYAELFS
ncbi:MAG: plasmid stability protein StbB [Methylomonas sp.]|nr:plasmid stability protein StbB [Methylomonas sp.]